MTNSVSFRSSIPGTISQTIQRFLLITIGLLQIYLKFSIYIDKISFLFKLVVWLTDQIIICSKD